MQAKSVSTMESIRLVFAAGGVVAAVHAAVVITQLLCRVSWREFLKHADSVFRFVK